jgi:predicted peptidase
MTGMVFCKDIILSGPEPTIDFAKRSGWVLTVLILLIASGVSATDLTQDDYDFRKEVYVAKSGDRLPYRLFVPLGYDKNGKYPLLLWLHASDGRGSDNVKQLTNENQVATHFWISKNVQSAFPVFLLVPQCAAKENWAEPELNEPGKSLQLAIELLKKIQTEFPIDPERIYVGGQGMGGLGVWSLLQKRPDLWAGAMVLSAYDNFTEVKAIATVPVWVFQGGEDDSVPVNMVRDMVRQLKKAKADVRYSEYRRVGRDTWRNVFAEPDLVSWLAAQRRYGVAVQKAQQGK